MVCKRVIPLLFLVVLYSPLFSQVGGLKGNSSYFKMPSNIKVEDFLDKHVIFKVNGAGKSLIKSNQIENIDLQKMLGIISGTITRKFPKHYPSDFSAHGFVRNPNENSVDLSLIFEIEYQGNYSVEQVINQLYSIGIVEYAEPIYIPKLLYSINDPLAFNAYYLDMVQAYAAWDVQKGDTNIVIGIVDTGVDILHPDIQDNIKHNYKDPIDGIDNDLDGKVDNFSGWDLGEDDNDPTPTAGGYHGLWVAGCAAAVPNNNSMGAGVGFNTKILPIKITNSAGYLTAAYDGIVYAADHGCKVINASWGSSGAYSMYNQEVINYAAINKGCIIVAAAGNDNNKGLFYPASYENVVSVGGTEQNDQKWVNSVSNGSNFNDRVDICAPSKAIWTTYQGGSYIKIGGGTSFASPQVAAGAALVWAQFPSYTAAQVVARIKCTADDLYSIPFNQTYAGQLGTGRLNVYTALTKAAAPYVGPVKIYSDNGVMAVGDTVAFWIDLQNYLSTASSVNATISTENENVLLLDSTANYGGFGTLESKKGDVPYRMIVLGTAAQNEVVFFMVTITDVTHTWKEAISININRDYLDIDKNLIQTSLTSIGTVGYNYAKQGSGFRYNNSSSAIYEMGIVVATDSVHLSSAREFDFNTEFAVKTNTKGESDFDVETNFNDEFANVNKLNISLNQKSMMWTSSGNNKYVILEYCIKNNGVSDLNDVYVGMYTDFDIIDRNTNKAGYVSSKRLGYAYRDGSAYYGVQMLSNESPFFYAFNNDGTGGSIKTNDGFSSAEQFISMKNGLARTSATYGDVSTMIGAGSLNISAGDSIWVAFALVAGDDLNDITTSASNALLKYKEIRSVSVTLDYLSDISCYGANDGNISMSLSKGKQPYKVTWTNLPGITTSSLSGLSKGTYQARIIDKLNFEVYKTFTINEPAKLVLEKLSITDVACFGKKTGQVEFKITGGTPSYYFNWNNPTIASVEKPGLPAGVHYLTISDANGCKITDTVKISQPTILAANTFATDDSTGSSTGKGIVSVSGGVVPYSYLWDDAGSSTDSLVNNLSAGTYTVNVVDKNLCTLTKTITIKNLSSKNTVFTYGSKSSLKAFPNPASSYFILEFELEKPGIIDLAIYDEGGKQVKKVISGHYYQGNYKVLVYTDDLSSGYYFYALKEEEAGSSGKLSVVK